MEKPKWQTHEPALRAAWEAKYGRTGLEWHEIRDAHRFGWEAALRPEFAQTDFAAAESDLAEHWNRPLSATEETAWDYVREAVSEGWRQARVLLRQRAVGE